MTDPLFVTLATIALIALSALCVIIEFALLGARRHRLEELAPTSRSARAALRGMNDLTVMLAGAQLGITACTFALGRDHQARRRRLDRAGTARSGACRNGLPGARRLRWRCSW
jgi:CBS domain containing-hemolysin-like protein